ncbi:MAG: cyclic nucleotide-binding domain-containing protein [Chloroflexi bacterium]|nr:cyclic nucleotide-binding domain-containing protein [Chloroflexota bacterium]
MSISTLLKRVQMFSSLDQTELEQLASICIEKKVAPGELIIEQGTTGQEMYVVGDGSVDVFIHSDDQIRNLVVLGKGQVIGEMALIDQGHRSASVRATKDGATLYVLQSDQFYKLCSTNHHIGFIVMRNLAIDIAFKLRHRNLDIA